MTDSEKLDLLLADMTDMKRDMTDMKRDMTDMKRDMTDMKRDMTDMKQDIGLLKHKVMRVEMVIENEIRVNIQRVAEGHLDLSRNLHKAMKPSNEVEMLALKVRKLESDVEYLKDKIS